MKPLYLSPSNKNVLLFFKDFERDSFIVGDRYIKRIVRPVYRLFNRKQKTSGFYVWYQLLIKAVQQQGYTVHLNNYKLARQNPDYPVGLVGYPHLLDNWSLPNPAILGPALFDHPLQSPDLMNNPSYKYYLLTCQWMMDMFTPYYGNSCVLWYAGMDFSQWAETSTETKDIDILIYDKVRWNRDFYEGELILPIKQFLVDKDLSFSVIRYGQYDHKSYKLALKKSRGMIFLCEHETQGMAYQEALASNVPILAWDNGYWEDPRRPKYEAQPVPASSVPYFSPECGEKFTNISEFQERFDKFWLNLGSYEPRKFVRRELSFEGSAKQFIKYYWFNTFAKSGRCKGINPAERPNFGKEVIN